MKTLELTQTQRDQIETLLDDTLPHGSGIDGKWEYTWHVNKVSAVNSFHRMNQNGYYCGWNGFILYINLLELSIKITGGHKQFNDYLDDTLRHWFSQAKADLASILGVTLIPREERRLLEISLQGWRQDMIKRYAHYGDWPEWAKEVSAKINTLCIDLDNKTDYKEIK
jgi:hypothetical protein